MDVEKEIRDLKLRMRAVEATARSGGEVSGGEASGGEASGGQAAGGKGGAGRTFDPNGEFAALFIELAGARIQTNTHFNIARSEIMDRFEVLRREMIALNLKLDLLAKHREA